MLFVSKSDIFEMMLGEVVVYVVSRNPNLKLKTLFQHFCLFVSLNTGSREFFIILKGKDKKQILGNVSKSLI